MHRHIYILVSLFFSPVLFSQSRFQQAFPKSAITAQFAGSTGLVTAGFSKVSARDKIEAGLLYGYTPQQFGNISALVLKGTYNPFHTTITEKIKLEPLQTGIFISQNFGKNLGLKWGEKYPYGYYWWTRSTRFHFFIGTQASVKINTKYMDRLAVYFEANTNDLSLYSYLPNRKALSLYDAFFFGTGIKLYLQ